MKRLALLLCLILPACGHGGDETLTAYGAGGQSYRLMEIDGRPFTAMVRISFPGPGQIAGEAPCNSFGGRVVVPYPWFGTERLAVTRRACPDLDQEAAFFQALEEMAVAEVSGPILLLTAPGTDRSMLFQAE